MTVKMHERNVARRILLIMSTLAFGVTLFSWVPKAQAVGPIGPDPADFNPTTRRVELVVSRTTNVNNSTSLVKLYFNAPSGSVRIEDTRLCLAAQGSSGNYYDIKGSAASGADATRYDLYNSKHTYVGNAETESLGALQVSHASIASGSSTCKDVTYTANLTGLSYSQDVGKYVAYLRATNLIASTQNSFRAVVTTNGYAIGYDSTISASQFGINQVSPLSGYTDYLLKFAGDCTLTSSRTETLQWYDDDNGTAGIQPTPMRFQLRKYPIAGGAYTVQPFTSIKRSDGAAISYSQSGGWYTAYSGTRQTVNANFTAQPGYKYIWYWDNVYYNNTLQFKLAFDSIYYNTGCQRPLDYNLTPSILMKVNGATAGANASAEVGDTVNFTYSVYNNGNDDSQNTACNIVGKSHAGYYNPGSTLDTTSDVGYGPPGTGCPRSFPGKTTTTVATENYTVKATDTNKTICRTFNVNPYKDGGGSKGTIVCFIVVAKPYVKIFGGDTSVGNGFGSTCTANPDGSITSWNKDSGASGYAGAGGQFGVYALDRIHNYASAQNTGAAAAPYGLSFANTGSGVVTSGGFYGGNFGGLPCTHDYYADKPATTTPLLPTFDASNLDPSVHAFSSGSPGLPTPVTITGGNINPNQSSTLYIYGDVFITGDIKYPASWDRKSVPFFKLVVKGNLYISPNVSQLDGAYIVQSTGTGGGTAYTCAVAMVPLTPNAALHNLCKGKQLVVNGLLSAPTIMLLRTYGTLGNSTAGENRGSTNAAEVFNYNPALWISQPNDSSSSGGQTGTYDSVTSLPPVL